MTERYYKILQDIGLKATPEPKTHEERVRVIRQMMAEMAKREAN